MAETEQEVVGIFSQPTEAYLARVRLASEGIESSLIDENIVTVNPLYANAVGGVKLVVREEDAQAARQIIETLESESRSRYQTNLLQCPNCKSEDVGKNTVGGTAIILLTILTLGLAWLLFYRRHKCNSCGHVW